jgi:hypothetical protein
VHWSPEEKRKILRDYMEEKGVHIFWMCMDEREGEHAGWNYC